MSSFEDKNLLGESLFTQGAGGEAKPADMASEFDAGLPVIQEGENSLAPPTEADSAAPDELWLYPLKSGPVDREGFALVQAHLDRAITPAVLLQQYEMAAALLFKCLAAADQKRLWVAVLLAYAELLNLAALAGFETTKAYALDLLARLGIGSSEARLSRLRRSGALWLELSRGAEVPLPDTPEPLIALLPAGERAAEVWRDLVTRTGRVPTAQEVKAELARLGITKLKSPKAPNSLGWVVSALSRALVKMEQGKVRDFKAEAIIRGVRDRAKSSAAQKGDSSDV